MSKNGPNKTVARARKAMGGFPAHEPRAHSPFMTWFFDQVQNKGRQFTSLDAAEAEFNSEAGAAVPAQTLTDHEAGRLRAGVADMGGHKVKAYGRARALFFSGHDLDRAIATARAELGFMDPA
jgi:hypothetical protein